MRALEDDREAVAGEAGEPRVVDARPGDDEAVDVLGPEQRLVRAAVGVERLDHDPEAGRSGGRGEAPERLGEGGVAGDLLGRLAQDEAQRVALAAGEDPGRGVGVVAELGRGQQDPLPGRRADVRAGPVVEDERHGRPRHARSGSHVRARRPSS